MTTIQLQNISGSLYIDRFAFAEQIPWDFSFPDSTYIFGPLSGRTVRNVVEQLVLSVEIRYSVPSVSLACTLSGCKASKVPVNLLVVLTYKKLSNLSLVREDEFELDALMDISTTGRTVNVTAHVPIPILTVIGTILKGSASPLDHGVIDIGIWTLGVAMDYIGIPRVYNYTVSHSLEL